MTVLAFMSPGMTFAQQPPPAPSPTFADVPYGRHPKQVLDFYQARSDAPTPVVVSIHGGGFAGGSKSPLGKSRLFLPAGISVVSVEYRFLQEAHDVQPPIKACLTDCARAVQFVRSKAGEWNIDTTRVAAVGGSAGGLASLWLAFHDDMADPTSSDPVSRESTRLFRAAGEVAQTTLDPQLIHEWIPNLATLPNVFGVKTKFPGAPRRIKDAVAERGDLLPWITEYSPLSQVSKDDPPVMLVYGGKPAMGQDQPDALHNANWGVPLAEKCREVGVECFLLYEGVKDVKHRTAEGFLVATLKQKSD